MNTDRERAGHALAMAASALLLCDVALLLAAGGGVLGALIKGASLEHLMTSSGLPVAIYLSWALGVFGSMAAILAIALFGCRERWFWRCLVIAALAWLIFPPIHAVIGLISLVLLLRYREAFGKRQPAPVPPP